MLRNSSPNIDRLDAPLLRGQNPEIELVDIPENRKDEAPANSEIPRADVDAPANAALALPPPMIAIAAPESVIHVYSNGHIRRLLTRAEREAAYTPAEIATAQAIQDEARCTTRRMNNTLRGGACGMGIGWFSMFTCGASISTVLGLAGLGAVFCGLLDPPEIFEDPPVENLPQVRRN
jgi:hypothetical protein